MSATAIEPPQAAATAWLDVAERRLFRLERGLCSAALLVMLLAVALSVVVRYFNLGLPNVAEWAVVAMSPLTFVGAAVCTYLQEHIAVDVIKLVRSESVRRAVRGAVALSLLVFSGVYAWIGYTFFVESLTSGETMLDLGTPVAVPVFFLFLGMVLMLLHGALEMWRVLCGRPAVAEGETA